jgi:flavin reductase (DIM6/NTAB) family NADH-FMN oxidoreductase RutF/rubredoxin
MNIEAFFKVSYGLYIIGAAYEGKRTGYVANTAFQVTAEPARFAISCSKDNYSIDIIRKSGAFSMSVLEKYESTEVIGLFGYKSTSNVDKFANTQYITGSTGSPIVVEKCIAWFECEIEQEVVLDTHVIFIGKMVANALLDEAKEPLTYSFFRDVRKGLAPKNAPTYVKKEQEAVPQVEEETTAGGDIYSCDLCGYEYDPAEGDPERGIPPGTAFEDLPDDWTCPVCDADKEDFTRQ